MNNLYVSITISQITIIYHILFVEFNLTCTEKRKQNLVRVHFINW